MRFKMSVLFAAFAMIFALSYSAEAQYITQDVIFLKAGYIPNYTVTFDEEGIDDGEAAGFAVQGEYNLNFDGFWLGFGLEYQRMVDEGEDGGEDTTMQFIQPMASAKLAAAGGLYIGAGLSGKYLITIDPDDEPTPSKMIDLWANGILGYHMPISEGVYLALEGRFGWNLTNHQFSEYEVGSETIDFETGSAYDMAFYVGVGTHAMGTGY